METDERLLDITGLIPDFSLFLSFDTAAGLSSNFVVFLLTFFVFFYTALINALVACQSPSWLVNTIIGEADF